MASGHASRIKGRTHGCSDQTCDVKKVLANTEPSTHGTFVVPPLTTSAASAASNTPNASLLSKFDPTLTSHHRRPR